MKKNEKLGKVEIWFNKLKELMEDINTVALSDMDFFYLVNDELPKEHRISQSYYEALKSPNQDNARSISSLEYLTDEQKKDFLNILNVGRIKQKINLTKNALDDDKKNAYPNLWFLERKNTDLQLKQTQQAQLGAGNTFIQLTVSNDDHKSLINGILNGEEVDFEEIEEVEPLKINKSDANHSAPDMSINPNETEE